MNSGRIDVFIRHCERSEAIQLCRNKKAGLLRRQALLAMTLRSVIAPKNLTI
jgi:hypothetical protein